MDAPAGSVRAAVVAVGDELLLGHTVDTNAAWLGRELGALGVRVVRRYTVGDVDEEIRWAVRDAMGSAELVLVSGGLGPTPDDVTRDAVAGLLDRPLRTDPDVLESIRTRFLEAGLEELPEPNRRVAEVPEGALKLANPVGTAPGLALAHDGTLVVLLPGVPRELRSIVESSLGSLLSRHFPGRLPPTVSRTLHTSGIPESLLAQQVREHLPEGTGAVRMAFLPDIRGVDLRFTVTGMEPTEAARHFDALEQKLESVLEPWRFDGARGDIADAVVAALRAQHTGLAVAESCTGGLVAKRLTDIPGASDVFLGGVVAYSNEAKVRQLGVDPGTLERHGAVSEAVAVAMAEGAARAFGAGAGIGVTGIAGPGGGTAEKPVGTVWYAACYLDRLAVRGQRFPGDRESVRERSAQAALMLLLRLLQGREAHVPVSRG